MSKKSTGFHLLVPDESVKEYSEQLNSLYIMLHHSYSTLLNLPNEIGSIRIQLAECRKFFYEIRELLEEDYCIHPDTVENLVIPDCSKMLQQLAQWEENFETGKNEYVRRQKDEHDVIKYNGEYKDFWENVRFTLWEVERCLRITRATVSREGLFPEKILIAV